MEAIQDKIAAWLPQNLLEELRSKKTAAAPNAQPWVLELKLPTIAAAGHLEFVNEVLANPRGVCIALWRYLVSKDALSKGSRVWLRTSMPWESSECAPLSYSLRLAAAAPSSLRSFSGVVAAISREEDFIVEITYKCGVCGSEERTFLSGSSSSPACCGFSMKHDLRGGLVLASARTILLASATSTASTAHPASTVAVPVVVRLLDDLASSCKPGDFVTCTGITECIAESRVCAQSKPALSEVHVEAVDVIRHPTALRIDELPERSNFIASSMKQAPGSLSALLGALNEWLHPPCCSLALAALLVSACSTNCDGVASPPSSILSTQEQVQLFHNSENDTLHLSNFRDSLFGNHRVNILLLTGGHDTIGNSIRLVAQALCAHVTDESLHGSNLLPTILEISGVPPLASVGQLAQANSGICLLAKTLTAKQGRAVGEALRAGYVTIALGVGQTCTVDVHPTIWCISAAPDILPKQQPKPAGKKFCKWSSNNAVAPLAVLFAEKSSPQLAAQFDVIIDCSSLEDDAAEGWADDYLNSIVYGERGEEEEEEEECFGNTSKREAARLALQSHIATCQHIPQPTMTASAMGLLKSYWTATRAAGEGAGGGAISAPSLETAAKLAAASARLFHRTEILAFPDATLAVAFCEEGLIARGWKSELWGPLREHMANGRNLDECLNELNKQLVKVSKQHGWEWDAQEE